MLTKISTIFLNEDAILLIEFARRTGKIKTTPVGDIGYLDPKTKGVKILASLPNDAKSEEFVGGDIKIDFSEKDTQVTAFFLEQDDRMYYDVRLRYAERGEQRGLTYRSNGSMDEIREEDHMILSYATVKAHRHITESTIS